MTLPDVPNARRDARSDGWRASDLVGDVERAPLCDASREEIDGRIEGLFPDSEPIAVRAAGPVVLGRVGQGWIVAACAVVAVTLGGLWLKGPDPAPTPEVAEVPVAALEPVAPVRTPTPPPAPAIAEPVRYLVRPGDSLWSIARAHYGNATRYHEIHEANRDRIADPHRIREGQVIRLPDLGL